MHIAMSVSSADSLRPILGIINSPRGEVPVCCSKRVTTIPGPMDAGSSVPRLRTWSAAKSESCYGLSLDLLTGFPVHCPGLFRRAVPVISVTDCVPIYGVFLSAESCTTMEIGIPDGLLTGDYEIEVKLPVTQECSDSVVFSVAPIER